MFIFKGVIRSPHGRVQHENWVKGNKTQEINVVQSLHVLCIEKVAQSVDVTKRPIQSTESSFQLLSSMQDYLSGWIRRDKPQWQANDQDSPAECHFMAAVKMSLGNTLPQDSLELLAACLRWNHSKGKEKQESTPGTSLSSRRIKWLGFWRIVSKRLALEKAIFIIFGHPWVYICTCTNSDNSFDRNIYKYN